MAEFAVVALDMTIDSMRNHREPEARRAVVDTAIPFLRWCRAQGMPVIFSNGARRPIDRWFWSAGWQRHSMAGDEGSAVYPPLLEPGDLVTTKRRYSNFFETELEITLRELGADSIILLGWSTSLALQATALDAWQRFFGVVVPADLTVSHAWGGRSAEETQAWSLSYMETFAVATITTSEAIMTTDVLARFQPGVRGGDQE